jgi:hypothetical protein
MVICGQALGVSNNGGSAEDNSNPVCPVRLRSWAVLSPFHSCSIYPSLPEALQPLCTWEDAGAQTG